MRTGGPRIDPTDLVGQRIGTLEVQAVLGYVAQRWQYQCRCTVCGTVQTRLRYALLKVQRPGCCARPRRQP